MDKLKLYLDADWTPEEIAERNRLAKDYSYACRRRWRDRSRKIDTFVQRLLVGSIGLFLWACVLALLVGGC